MISGEEGQMSITGSVDSAIKLMIWPLRHQGTGFTWTVDAVVSGLSYPVYFAPQ